MYLRYSILNKTGNNMGYLYLQEKYFSIHCLNPISHVACNQSLIRADSQYQTDVKILENIRIVILWWCLSYNMVSYKFCFFVYRALSCLSLAFTASNFFRLKIYIYTRSFLVFVNRVILLQYIYSVKLLIVVQKQSDISVVWLDFYTILTNMI